MNPLRSAGSLPRIGADGRFHCHILQENCAVYHCIQSLGLAGTKARHHVLHTCSELLVLVETVHGNQWCQQGGNQGAGTTSNSVGACQGGLDGNALAVFTEAISNQVSFRACCF